VAFGQRLRAARLAAGLTREGLAREAGLSKRVVHYHEKFGGKPRPGTLAKLARVLGPGLLGLTNGRRSQ
jgi:transcriptional regulator with XRE-family HTH domain